MAGSTAAATTSCRSCGARVVFATMAKSGKLAPFEPDADGEWVIDSQGAASHQGKPPAFMPEEKIVPRWTSHFATCPQSKNWRKK